MAQASGRMDNATRFAPIAFLGLALFFLWPLALNPNAVAVRPGSVVSDLLLSHLPNALYIRQSLSAYGQWPLWNAQIMSGQPFAGDPLSGLWYPPNLALLVLPLPFAFNLLFVLHLAWGGYGVFRFLLANNLSGAAAMFGGFAFTGTPKLMAHLGVGHVTLVFAVVWTPWLLWAVRRAATSEQVKEGALAGAILALIFLADVRWAFYAGLLAGAYWVNCVGLSKLKARRVILTFLAFGLFVILISAILAWPLIEFILQSDRTALTLSEAGLYSLPPYPYLFNIFYPIDGVLHEWVLYFGIVPLILAVVGAISGRRWFWLGAAVVAGLYSLGTYGPLFPVLFQRLPFLSFLRVPPRAWFIVILAGCILAGYGLDALRTLQLDPAKFPLFSKLKLDARWVLLILFLITGVDLLRTNLSAIAIEPLPPQTPAAQWLASQPGLFRVYSPSQSLPWPDALQHAEGVNPLHLRAYADFMIKASGIPKQGYSVSVPPFFIGDSTIDPNRLGQAASLDPKALGLLNVQYVAANFPLKVSGLVQRQCFEETCVYENTFAKPRAWVEQGTAQVASWTPNRVEIQATGPGQLVVSEMMYPGWQASVDGVATPLEAVDGLFRGVQLESGSHRVVMAYYPLTVYLGGGASLVGLVLLLILWWRS
jgi:Bacterial membrane protein YfhO